MKRYENLEEAMCRELEKLDKKYGAAGTEMSMQDLEMARLLYSSLMKAETVYSMKEEREMNEGDMDGSGRGRYGRSYRRGRDAMGRYVSRGMGPVSYDMDGYSGHYPDWMPYYR